MTYAIKYHYSDHAAVTRRLLALHSLISFCCDIPNKHLQRPVTNLM